MIRITFLGREPKFKTIGHRANGKPVIIRTNSNGWHPPCYGHTTADAADRCYRRGGCAS